MANENVELWIQVIAIIVGLAGALAAAFGGAYFGAKKIHALEMQQRQKEEEEKAEAFKEVTLRKLWEFASLLSEKEIGKERERLENLITSLRSGDASALYYRISKEKRKEIDSVLNLLSLKEYSEAKDKIESLINQ